MDDDLTATLTDLERSLGDIQRVLQDMAAVAGLIEDAESEGFDTSEQTVAELLSFVQSEMDADEEAVMELQDAADAFLQTVDADALDAVSAEAMGAWLEDTGAEEEDEGEDPEEESMETEDGESQATMEELEQVKDTIGTVAEHMGDIKDMLQAREGEREETLEQLERRLSDIEDEGVKRSLTGHQSNGEFIDTDDETTESEGASGPPML